MKHIFAVVDTDSIQPWTTEFMVVASSHLGTTIPEPLPEFSRAVPDSEVLELSEIPEVLWLYSLNSFKFFFSQHLLLYFKTFFQDHYHNIIQAYLRP